MPTACCAMLHDQQANADAGVGPAAPSPLLHPRISSSAFCCRCTKPSSIYDYSRLILESDAARPNDDFWSIGGLTPARGSCPPALGGRGTPRSAHLLVAVPVVHGWCMGLATLLSRRALDGTVCNAASCCLALVEARPVLDLFWASGVPALRCTLLRNRRASTLAGTEFGRLNSSVRSIASRRPN